ncbi:MAG: HIT family protein [Lentisphaerae bacterium]|nr:HIT family protein [Lentisphaerota bacterium]
MTLLVDNSPFAPLDPARIILDTPHAVAFYDHYPVSEGHALVVPKVGVLSLYELEPEVQAAVWDLVRRVQELLEERYSPDGFNIGVNDGLAAGQTVPHAHVHVIPRYKGDMPDPRGGIRWVLQEKAQYWEESSA